LSNFDEEPMVVKGLISLSFSFFSSATGKHIPIIMFQL
jgi:hypothetical protein